MRFATTRNAGRALALLGAAAVLLVLATSAGAGESAVQPWDHYKSYMVMNPVAGQMPVTLIDQFGEGTYPLEFLEQFAVPAMKNGEPIYVPEVHYTWWRIFRAEPGRRVMVSNQFGEQALDVMAARYLLAPAFKNTPGAAAQGLRTASVPFPQNANHYKCYDAFGPPVGVPATLETQFGFEDVMVMHPELLCNPAEKITPDGLAYPIIDPHYHLVCYRIDPPQPIGVAVTAFDQFGEWYLHLDAPTYLCVPSLKTGVVPTETSTWSRVKGLYR